MPTEKADRDRVSDLPHSPLSPEHLRLLAQVRDRMRKPRRAVMVATISGWSLVAFAMLSLPFAALGDWTALMVGAALAALGINELLGGAMIRRLDPRGAWRLGLNQLALGGLIVSYSGWQLFASLKQPALASVGGSYSNPDVDAMVKELTVTVSYALYGGMAVLGLLVPGLTAWYYFSRRGMIERVLAESPAWAIEAMRAAV